MGLSLQKGTLLKKKALGVGKSGFRLLFVEHEVAAIEEVAMNQRPFGMTFPKGREKDAIETPLDRDPVSFAFGKGVGAAFPLAFRIVQTGINILPFRGSQFFEATVPFVEGQIIEVATKEE